MLGVHVPAGTAVPLIVALGPCLIHPVHSMAAQVEDGRRDADERKREEQSTAIEDGEDV